MKRFIIFLGVISLFTILSSCSSNPSIKLVNSNVSITTDKDKLGSIGITQGAKKGKYLVPTALYYEFEIKNVGNKKTGDFGGKGLKIKIEPNSKLEILSKEIVGFNIFNFSSYVGSGVGHGSSFVSLLEPGQEEKFILSYDLGVSEKNSEVPLMVPSTEKLKKLEEGALDASLIVTLEDKEIARFDLTKK